ncbi:hypothetical protein R6Q57_022663 [Mikania cordata]
MIEEIQPRAIVAKPKRAKLLFWLKKDGHKKEIFHQPGQTSFPLYENELNNFKCFLASGNPPFNHMRQYRIIKWTKPTEDLAKEGDSPVDSFPWFDPSQ